MDAYQRMLEDCERAGHDMTQAKAAYAKHLATQAPAAPAPLHSTVIAISLDDIADAVDKAIVGECNRRQIDEIEPLIARIDELEGRVAALEAELAKAITPRPRAVG